MNSPVEMTLKDVSVLIAEDSPTQAMRLQFFLEKQGCRVTSAHNGKEALDRLKENQPALVITDINMPEMDGYELCRRIKDSPGYEKVPVILLTALSDPKDILRGLECGADNFVVKPYSEEFLLTRVKHVLANLELRQTSAGQVTEVYFAGQKYKINSGRTPSMDLLLSTYEMALQKNQELSRAKNRLEQQAGLLREKNAEMEADLEMARELQSAFLPRHYPVFPAAASPERSAIQFCHRYATTTELGGDFFDILRLSDTQAGIFICDVMGHGVRAALVTAIIRGLVEELGSAASDPGRFLTEINRSLCSILHQTVTPLFASAFYLVVDTAAASLEWANAGHPAPFHLRRSASETRRLEIIGQRSQPVLGLIDTIIYPASRSSVEAGDLVMLFTDGLYELESAEGLYYDSELLMGATHQKAHLTTPALFDALLTELRHLSATGEFTDDMCLVGMDVTRTFSA